MKKPKIILWDIETTHNIVAAFGIYDQNIPIDAIIRERCIICACWKELGENKVYSSALTDDMKRFKRNPGDDKVVVKALHKMLMSADVIVAHNGDRFDIKWFNTRALFHGLKPLPKIPSIDTYKVARHKLYLNSNKLDYLGKILKVGRKDKTNLAMWLGVLNGSTKAVKDMVKYNKQDVLLLERVYLKIRGLVAHHPSYAVLSEADSGVCARCGGEHLQHRGYSATATAKYRRYSCNDCGGWMQGRTNLLAYKKKHYKNV